MERCLAWFYYHNTVIRFPDLDHLPIGVVNAYKNTIVPRDLNLSFVSTKYLIAAFFASTTARESKTMFPPVAAIFDPVGLKFVVYICDLSTFGVLLDSTVSNLPCILWHDT